MLGASRRSRWQRLVHGDVIDRVLRNTGSHDVGVDVHVIEAPAPAAAAARPPRISRSRWPAGLRSGLPRRRQLVGCVLGLSALLAATLTLTSLGHHVELSTVVLTFLAVVIVTTSTAGPLAGLTVALAAFLLENYYFVEPTHTFTVASTEGVVSLVGFLAFAVGASLAANRLARRNRQVERARAEANALARSAATLAADADSLPSLVDNLRTTFDLESVGSARARRARLAAARQQRGRRRRRRPADGEAFDVAADTVLVLVGGPLGSEERPLVEAFADQAAAVLEARRLRQEAAEAEVIAKGDALRTGLLRSVSHDLRTPLAGIKASVTSLLSDDVTWNQDAARDFLQTIDAECDRLTRLVEQPARRQPPAGRRGAVARVAVAPDDVLAAALGGVPGADDPERLRIELPDDLPLVTTDPDLLERVLANVVANALRYSPAGPPGPGLWRRRERPGGAAGHRPGQGDPGHPPRRRPPPLPAARRPGPGHRDRPRPGGGPWLHRTARRPADPRGHPRRRADRDDQHPPGARCRPPPSDWARRGSTCHSSTSGSGDSRPSTSPQHHSLQRIAAFDGPSTVSPCERQAAASRPS